jgi:Cof subfamily protein (haloacid dehalogenase superfamily)
MTADIDKILVVSDIDGTILQAGYGIPGKNIETIEEFVELGGRFTLATGRGITATGKYTDFIHLSVPAILVNGGMIYDYGEKKVLREHTLEPEARSVLREIMDVFPNLGVEILIRETSCAVRMNEEVLNHTAVEHLPFVLTDLETVEDGWNKVLFGDKPEEILIVKDYVENRCKHDERFRMFDFVQTAKIYYELIPKGINKADALRELAEITDTEMENTVVIGDYYNDVELLEAAGISAVVGDAPDDVKEIADIVVKPCLEGGVAELLEMIMNNELK